MLNNLYFIFFALFSLYAYGDCEVSENIKNKTCSNDFYTAKNSKDLDEYLSNGKFRNSELLNLKIDFDIKNKEVSISTSCDLKIAYGVKLKSTLNDICLKGKNVYFEGGNQVSAEKRGQIDIISKESLHMLLIGEQKTS